MKWALGKTSPKKRIHRADCKYAKHPYGWAGDRTERQLFDALMESGAAAWHDAGQCCCPDLDWALHLASATDSSRDLLPTTVARLGT